MGDLHYSIYRGPDHSNEHIIYSIIEQTKNVVFEEIKIDLRSQGYSGVPLRGIASLSAPENDLWKLLDILFTLSRQLDGLVFQIRADRAAENPFYRECVRNEVVPQWCSTAEDFNRKVYGFGGVLHSISPELKQKNPNTFDLTIVRENPRSSRNILITEAVRQRIHQSSLRNFGMQRSSVNIPEELAYIAKQRPDLLNAAIMEYKTTKKDTKQSEQRLEKSSCVMVHIMLNEACWKVVTAFADIDAPSDIVSHRVGIAMLEFDDRYSTCQNGVIENIDMFFRDETDAFERERLLALYLAVNGKPQSMAHMYQMAKSLVTSKHKALCTKLFADLCKTSDGMSSTDRETACSGDDEDDTKRDRQKKHVYKKKRGDVGKKRTLATILPKSNAPRVPVADIEELPTPTSSGQLRDFERAVNGDDIYKESSDEQSLGEEEELDIFVNSKTKETVSAKSPRVLSDVATTASDDDTGFEVSDLLNSIPPLAGKDDEDYDDI